MTDNLPLLPDVVENAADPDCQICGGAAWVCEDHPDRVWDGVSNSTTACTCGAAGAPCRCTGMDGPVAREVVECVEGPACHDDHHGWDCPLSDPLGDCLRVLMDPSPNPILERSRQATLSRFGVEVLGG